MSTLKFARTEGNQYQKFARKEMLERDEHAEAMSQVIEEVYSLDLFGPPA